MEKAANQTRIIIPTIYRNNYLSRLKALTHNSHPEALIRTLDFAQKYTSRIDWSDYKTALKTLIKTYAFEDAAQGELMGFRLLIP